MSLGITSMGGRESLALKFSLTSPGPEGEMPETGSGAAARVRIESGWAKAQQQSTKTKTPFCRTMALQGTERVSQVNIKEYGM